MTRRLHKTTFRGFFSVKNSWIFTYTLAPFLTNINSVNRTYTFYTYRNKIRGGHRHLQIGRMLDIDPQMYVFKVWEFVWPELLEAIHVYLGSQDVTYLSLHPLPLPPRVEVKGRKASFCPPLNKIDKIHHLSAFLPSL